MSNAMTGHSSPDWDKLGRYLAGEASPAEVAAVRRWLEEHPGDARAIAALDAATKGVAPGTYDVESALRRVKTRAKARSPWYGRYARNAAAAAVLLVAGAILMLRSSRNTPSSDSHTYSTGVGERDSVVLADGSRILLGPASRVV